MTNASELIFVGIDVSKDTLEVALDDSAKTQTLGNEREREREREHVGSLSRVLAGEGWGEG